MAAGSVRVPTTDGGPGVGRRQPWQRSLNGAASSWTCSTRTRSARTCSLRRSRLGAEIEAARAQAGEEDRPESLGNELVVRFEQVARILRALDIGSVWDAAEGSERRVLVEELVDFVTVFPDHLEVTVGGAPPTEPSNWQRVSIPHAWNVSATPRRSKARR